LSVHPENQIEALLKHQALTDFCHTSLRVAEGISFARLESKFDAVASAKVLEIAQPMLERGLLKLESNHLQLTHRGVLISNQIFEKFTFLANDISA
jgi:oxygen-independent coproporphyrinogen-3 oxidase